MKKSDGERDIGAQACNYGKSHVPRGPKKLITAKCSELCESPSMAKGEELSRAQIACSFGADKQIDFFIAL
jgi:hypothetical protein